MLHHYFPLSIFFFSGRDATEVFESLNHSEEAREMMTQFHVGQYVDVSNLLYMRCILNIPKVWKELSIWPLQSLKSLQVKAQPCSIIVSECCMIRPGYSHIFVLRNLMLMLD